MTSPFNWQRQKPTIDIQKDSAIKAMVLKRTKQKDFKPQLTFTKKGQALKDQRNALSA